MPVLATIKGYTIFFWVGECGELIHVHVTVGRQHEGATKVWLLSNGDVLLAHNKSRIPDHVLNQVYRHLRTNWGRIVTSWSRKFGYVSYIV